MSKLNWGNLIALALDPFPKTGVTFLIKHRNSRIKFELELEPLEYLEVTPRFIKFKTW